LILCNAEKIHSAVGVKLSDKFLVIYGLVLRGSQLKVGWILNTWHKLCTHVTCFMGIPCIGVTLIAQKIIHWSFILQIKECIKSKHFFVIYSTNKNINSDISLCVLCVSSLFATLVNKCQGSKLWGKGQPS